jgi:hypothetical protein
MAEVLSKLRSSMNVPHRHPLLATDPCMPSGRRRTSVTQHTFPCRSIALSLRWLAVSQAHFP